MARGRRETVAKMTKNKLTTGTELTNELKKNFENAWPNIMPEGDVFFF